MADVGQTQNSTVTYQQLAADKPDVCFLWQTRLSINLLCAACADDPCRAWAAQVVAFIGDLTYADDFVSSLSASVRGSLHRCHPTARLAVPQL